MTRKRPVIAGVVVNDDVPIPGVVTNITDDILQTPAFMHLCDPPRGEDVEPGDEVAVSDIRGFDVINWKVKAD